MKKRNALLLALALAATPAAGFAQDLPELFTQVYQSVGEGLDMGVALAGESLTSDLTLTLDAGEGRIEAGKTALLTIVAGNPMAVETGVNITLKLPERLEAAGETTFAAVLPAAQFDAETGELKASETTFTREVTLLPGGESEQAAIECEMSMGTRFYRAGAPMALCVPDVYVSAAVDGAQRLTPGDEFAYVIEVENAGDAPKDVALEMALPERAALAGALPQGFVLEDGAVRGMVHAAAAADAPSSAVITLPVRIAQDALAGDEDARRLISGRLTADGERIATPRIEVCDAKISARLTAQETALAAGEEMVLSVVVVNSGLAAADVQLSCMLPEGLSLAGAKEREATAAETSVLSADGDGGAPEGEAIPVKTAMAAPAMQENRTLMFDVHMDAASEEGGSVVANTQVLHIPVVADLAQDDLGEKLLGASLLWRVGGEDAQLGDAVAMRVYRAKLFGLSSADLNGIFWAGVLLAAMVICLYAAVKREGKETDFCCE